jgi:hypothetical protein
MKYLLPLLLSCLLSPSFGQSEQRFTADEVAYMREKADIMSAVVDTIPPYSSVEYLGRADKAWSKVAWNGEIGFTITSHLFKRKPEIPQQPVQEAVAVSYQWDDRLGCYYLNKKGQKIPVVNSLCEGSKNTSGKTLSTAATPGDSIKIENSSGHAYSNSPNHTGPRGGVYHITKSGKKSYYKRKTYTR